MTGNPRSRRIADSIKKIVATALDSKVKDPRLGWVTITDVRVSGDGQQASVFYTVFGGEEERRATAAALKSSTGMLRTEVGKGLGIRLTPSLKFFEDAIPETAKTIDDLLVEARSRDAELARYKEGKEYAGGENPYRDDADADGAGDIDDIGAEAADDDAAADSGAAVSEGEDGERA